MASIDFVGVDWGTSSFRAWHCLAGKASHLIYSSDMGMSKVPQDDFAPYLEKILIGAEISETVPILICGMAGRAGRVARSALCQGPRLTNRDCSKGRFGSGRAIHVPDFAGRQPCKSGPFRRDAGRRNSFDRGVGAGRGRWSLLLAWHPFKMVLDKRRTIAGLANGHDRRVVCFAFQTIHLVRVLRWHRREPPSETRIHRSSP